MSKENNSAKDALFALFANWDISLSQQASLLGFESEGELVEFKQNLQNASLTEELTYRVALLLDIHASLSSRFSPNQKMYLFMTSKNSNAPFHGERPVDFAGKSYEHLKATQKAVFMLTHSQ